MKLKRLWAVALPRLVRLFTARCGYVLLPISEIELMEKDAESYYRAMKGELFDDKGTGYFNGLGDYSSKLAIRLREKYLPNVGRVAHADENQSNQT